MNLEDLTKSQLILLTVLINFVTSIATGILTVSLLDQAPPVVTQTVNRIVEHTVETVAQAAPAAVVAAPQPSVEDLITAAFAADSKGVVAVYGVDTGTSTDPVAVGTYLPKSRAVVTASASTLPKEVLIGFGDGSYAPASLSHADDALAIYGFADSAALPAAPSPKLLSSADLKVGQTALALTKDGSAATGIIAKVADDGIHTNLPETNPGAAAVDLSGNLIGISGAKPGIFISAEDITALLTATSSPSVSTTQ